MPIDRSGLTNKVEIQNVTGGVVEGYIIVNTYEDGRLGEIFLQGFGREGSTMEGWVNVSAMLFSLLIQYGGEMAMVCRKLAHMKFEPYGETNNPDIPYCYSVPDYLARLLVLHFGSPALRAQIAEISREMGRA